MIDHLFLWLAQGQTTIEPEEIGIPRVDDPGQAAGDLLNATYVIAGIVCVIVIIVAGFMFMTASGDASLIKKAREMVVGAVIGLLVIILAFVITGFILGRFAA
jgi:cytochrome bd-type quinol oxidase subunit 2